MKTQLTRLGTSVAMAVAAALFVAFMSLMASVPSAITSAPALVDAPATLYAERVISPSFKLMLEPGENLNARRYIIPIHPAPLLAGIHVRSVADRRDAQLTEDRGTVLVARRAISIPYRLNLSL